MTPDEIIDHLNRIPKDDDFDLRTDALTDALTSSNAGFETIDPILQFMENNPSIEFGSPGGLAHYIERFYGPPYVEKIVQSVQRKPTSHTTWLLSRIINSTDDALEKQRLIDIVQQVKQNPRTDPLASKLAASVLIRLKNRAG